jgi:hypothetical protein
VLDQRVQRRRCGVPSDDPARTDRDPRADGFAHHGGERHIARFPVCQVDRHGLASPVRESQRAVRDPDLERNAVTDALCRPVAEPISKPVADTDAGA